MTKTQNPATCRRCNRANLRTAASRAAGIGPVCARKERIERHEAAIVAAIAKVDVTAFKDAKTVTDKAEQLILDGAIRPGRAAGQYYARSSDGTVTYFVDTTETTCTCPAGQRISRCNHLVAATALNAVDLPAA